MQELTIEDIGAQHGLIFELGSSKGDSMSVGPLGQQDTFVLVLRYPEHKGVPLFHIGQGIICGPEGWELYKKITNEV